MRTWAAGLVGGCIGASIVGLLWSSERQARVSPVGAEAAAVAQRPAKSATVKVVPPTGARPKPSPMLPAGAASSSSPSSSEANLDEQTSNEPLDHAARVEIANRLVGKGFRWEAEHSTDETERTRAQLLLQMKESYDKMIDDEEPDRVWNREVSNNLERLLEDGDTHVAATACSKVACRVELIHEDNAVATDFRPEILMQAAPHTHMNMILDSTPDGQARHFVYYRKKSAATASEERAAGI